MRPRILTIPAVAGMALFLGISTFEAKANPVTVTITSVTGTWTSVTGNPVFGLGTDTISWPPGGNPPSSYVFTGSPGGPFNVGNVFDLGTFTHNNNPIPSGTAITGATLSLHILGSAQDGTTVPIDLTSVFVFTHNETPNVGPPGCCDDIVTAVTNAGNSQSVLIDGVDYLFAFSGFLVGGNLLDHFNTVEGQSNTATIQGTFISRGEVPDVPIPGALPLFASAAGLLGFMGWRRTKRGTA